MIKFENSQINMNFHGDSHIFCQNERSKIKKDITNVIIEIYQTTLLNKIII